MGSNDYEILAEGTWIKTKPDYLYGWHSNIDHVQNEIYGRVIKSVYINGNNVYRIRFMVPPKPEGGEWHFVTDSLMDYRVTPTNVTDKRAARWSMMVMKG